jgi:ribosomal protein S18 acetylase RimI-like enzyme
VKATAQPFEAEFVGGPVYRLTPNGAWHELEATVGRLVGEGAHLVMCRVPESEEAGARALLDAGFLEVEQLLTLRRTLPSTYAMPPGVDDGTPSDRDACAELGRTCFRYDRFHADPRIRDASADALKAAWSVNSLMGRADRALVFRDEGRVLGFNYCMRREGDAVIDLIAVAAEARGRGIGRALVRGAFAAYAGVLPAMRVSTQESNTPSTALYLSEGFERFTLERTFHYVPDVRHRG